MKEKSRKLFEKVDDNPGAYFGMLVEGLENEKNLLKEDSEYKTLAKLSNGLEVISYPYGYAVSDGYVADRFVVRDGKYIFDDGRFRLSDKDKGKILNLIKKGVIEESLKESYSKSDLYSSLEYMYGFNKKEANDWIKKASDKMKQSVVDGWKGNAKKSALTDSLKEDKFVSRDKMSKKDKKELDSQKRNTWGNTNPVTRVQPNKKAYDRKRDKKANLDESVRDFEWDRKLWCVVNDNGSFAGSPCLSWEEARELSAYHDGSRIYEMNLDKDQIHNDEEDLSAYGMEYGYYN